MNVSTLKMLIALYALARIAFIIIPLSIKRTRLSTEREYVSLTINLAALFLFTKGL